MANEVVKLQSGLSREPPIATFAIAHRSTPERLAISSAIYTAGWRKFVPPPRGDVTRSRRTSEPVEFVAKPQLSDIKPKVWETAFPSCSAPSALFFSK